MSARTLTLAALALSLAGCASFSPDGGFGPVEQAVQTQLGKDLRWARSEADRRAIDARVAELLARPLGIDDAVQVALLNNPGLQASYFDLGLAEADLVAAGRLPNPGFGFSRLTRGDEVELERGLHFNVARLLAMPWLKAVEARRFEQAQRDAVARVLALAADARKAWVMAVAAQESLRYAQQVLQAAEAGAELARRMAQVGNFNKLQQAREQSFYADAAVAVVRAQQHQHASRERLIRVLGLWGPQIDFRLPQRLPDLPAQPPELPDIERRAMAQRLDVQAARLAAERTAEQLGLSRVTRLVNVLELGVVRNGSNEAPTQRGWELTLALPLFDAGGTRVARAESTYLQAVQHVAEVAITARSEVREAYVNLRASHDIARHLRDEVLPLRQRIADENLLRYNGMLIGVFELLADARAQIGSVNSAIEALRDHWLAQADLDAAMVGKPTRSPGPVAAGLGAASTEAAGH